MNNLSLKHTRWKCKYHIVFAPKFRRKLIYGRYRRTTGEILRKLCEYKGLFNVPHLLGRCEQYKTRRTGTGEKDAGNRAVKTGRSRCLGAAAPSESEDKRYCFFVAATRAASALSSFSRLTSILGNSL